MDALIHSDNHQNIDEHAARIRSSGILARSSHLQSLFEYLYTCHINNKTPKEVEIAIEGLGRDADFDVTQDALVRVYAHKLRRKLDEFYEHQGKGLSNRLALPKGEYRLVLETNEPSTPAVNPTSLRGVDLSSDKAKSVLPTLPEQGHRKPLVPSLIATIVLLLVVNLLQWQPSFGDTENSLSPESLWYPLVTDTRPVLLVVGDYFIYAESDQQNNVTRLVRDFDINSPLDLSSYLQINPEEVEHKFDVGLSYLPTSSAYALYKISPLLAQTGKEVQVVLASQLTAEALRNSHIVFIGHLSGLGVLSDAIFDISHFSTGARGFDELVDNTTGESYINSSGSPGDHYSKANHLAYLSSFEGPTRNRIITIAGFRDAGLIELVNLVSNSDAWKNQIADDLFHSAFEAIYKADGFGKATVPASLVIGKSLAKPAALTAR